jgi:hypothetical protein
VGALGIAVVHDADTSIVFDDEVFDRAGEDVEVGACL